ncbi:MAG: hypothetical protein GY785_05820 [Gammaproteobacteria bacterium]|nr:hypothetical protein [Gammaproteobacteria bacterium]
MKRIYQFCFATGVAALLASCSMIDFAYDNAPAYVAGEFDEAFDLNDSQRDQLDSRLKDFFAWHRKEELTRYQQILQRAALSAADGIESAEFLAFYQGAHQGWRRALEKFIDGLGDLAITLSPAQIEHYQGYYLDDSGEQEGYLDKTVQQREIYRVERSLARLQKWFGQFDAIQREKIAARLAQLPDIYQHWYRYRQARQRALIEALGGTREPQQMKQRLKTVLLDTSSEYARAFEPHRSAYWQAYAEAVEDISAWLTRAQIRKAVDKLQDYARSAERISTQD